jgi:antitoxin component YwqK of YwqJK toxin-antitoxin module
MPARRSTLTALAVLVAMSGGTAMGARTHRADGPNVIEAHYRDGLLDGEVRGWYENGVLEYQRTYRQGREEGEHRGWYPDGHPKFVYHYVHGLSEGSQQVWYPGGQPFTSFHHHEGHEAGQQQMWNADGSIRSNYVVRDGRRYGLLGARGCTGQGTPNAEATR